MINATKAKLTFFSNTHGTFNKTEHFLKHKTNLRGFPDGLVVKKPPVKEEDAGLIPAAGGSHMMMGQLSPCATTTAKTHPHLQPELRKRRHHNEEPAHRNWRVAPAHHK